LISHLLQCSVSALPSKLDEPFVHEIELNKFLVRRLEGEPLQYILGEWEFMGFPILVSPDVLIPRPETELLVEKAIELIRRHGYKKVLDLCTGSGCIAVALAKLANVDVYASDISQKCCETTEINATRNGVHVHVRCGDLFSAVESERFDLIVSNPPYLTLDDMNQLQNELHYEPRLALFGGDDGLDFYRKISQQYRKYLTKTGKLLLEIGSDQSHVSDMFDNASLFCDYAGHPRMILAD